MQREVRDRAPEVHEREAVRRAAVGEAAVVDLDLARDVDVLGRRAEAGDLGVVADARLQRIVRGAVGAGKEEHAVARGRHLGVALRVGELVEHRLHLAERRVGRRRSSTFGPKSGANGSICCAGCGLRRADGAGTVTMRHRDGQCDRRAARDARGPGVGAHRGRVLLVEGCAHPRARTTTVVGRS